jgi:putative membrane-bound dehydrogenase-like protein
MMPELISVLLLVSAPAQNAPDQHPKDELAEQLPRLKPTSPEASLKTFRIDEGFQVELAAAEPEVTDPVAIDFDEDGRMYVCELWNYPETPKPGGVLGRIRLLEDTRGSGRYDKSTLFADKVPHPAGIACWKGGVFVLSSPDVLYLKDTSGSGHADLRKVVYRGFRGQTYEVPNTLRWGLDNKIYGASSYAGGRIESLERRGAPPVDVGHGKDYRFDPVTGAFEAVSGSAEFGNCFDDWGNRYNCSAGSLIIHPILPLEYLERNPYLPTGDLSEYPVGSRSKIHSISEPEPWRVVRLKYWSLWVNTSPDMRAGRFPAEELAVRGFATAAAGVTVYRGSAYPEAYQGNAFTGEPANNVVVRMVLQADGVSIKALRPDPGNHHEFLESTDPWFRPVNFANGPDGCLYVVAMYREVIEDHSAIPNDILKYLDLNSGRDMGRIYRIVPKTFNRPQPPRLGRSTTAELASAIVHPDAWWRETAQRLLLERQDKAAIASLRKLAAESKLPQGRIHALWTLLGLGGLDEPTLVAALGDPDPHVREHALRVSEGNAGSSIAVAQKMASLADDPSTRVRFQAALSLHSVPEGVAIGALAAIARRDAADRWVRTALLSAVPTRAAALYGLLLGDDAFLKNGHAAELLGDLARMVGTRNQSAEIGRLLAETLAPALKDQESLRRTVMTRLAEGLSKSGSSLSDQLQHAGGEGNRIGSALESILAEAQRVARDDSKPVAGRVEAVQILGYAPFKTVSETLSQLLDPGQPPPVQLGTVRALSAQPDVAAGKILIDRWRILGPSVRPEAVETLFRRTDRLALFLGALETGAIPAGELEPDRRQRLLGHPDPDIRERAGKLYKARQVGDKHQLIEKYRSEILKLTGEAARGAEVFKKTCAICHGKDAQGQTVGPDLGQLQDRSPDTLLVAILDPNRDVKPNYINYLLMTTDEQVLSGIIVSETATSVTLRRPGGAEDTVLRKNIKALRSTALSLMPEGLEAGIDPGQMADLLRFLQTLR